MDPFKNSEVISLFEEVNVRGLFSDAALLHEDFRLGNGFKHIRDIRCYHSLDNQGIFASGGSVQNV